MDDETRKYNEYAHQISTHGSPHIPGIQLALFQNYTIRRTWHEGEWWYSCVDVMVPLSLTKDPQNYWNTRKRRMLHEEEVDVTQLGVKPLKLPTKRGQMRPTDCASMEILLRIVQSIPSPNAEPFKLWLARVGAMMMDDTEEHIERVSHRTRLYYFDQELHQEAAAHGVETDYEHAALEDANWAGLYLVTGEFDLIRQHRHGHLPGSLPDTMGSMELAANIFQRATTKDMITDQDLEGIDPIVRAAQDVGMEIRATLARLGRAMPEDMPQYPPLVPGEWMPPDHPSRIDWDAPDEIGGEEDGGSDITVIEIIAPK